MKPKKTTFLLLVLTLVFASTAFDCGVKELNKNNKTNDPFARVTGNSQKISADAG